MYVSIVILLIVLRLFILFFFFLPCDLVTIFGVIFGLLSLFYVCIYYRSSDCGYHKAHAIYIYW